eukprot:gene3681-4028_t
MAGLATTMISVDFPDGNVVSFDRARREMILTIAASGRILTFGAIPARPSPPRTRIDASGKTVALDDLPLSPVTRTATVMKLGFKKFPILGTPIWNKRFIRLTENEISYHASEETRAKGTIRLSPGVKVGVIHANDPARKDRHKGGQGLSFSDMTSPSNMMDPRKGTLSKDNCVEVSIPANLGKMVDNLANMSPLSMGHMGNHESRTYYFSFDNLVDAQQFADAIKTNIKVLNSKEQSNSAAGATAGANVNNVMNRAMNLMNNMELMSKPETSLEWYRTTLNTTLPAMEIYERLQVFYDNLAAVNIRPNH